MNRVLLLVVAGLAAAAAATLYYGSRRGGPAVPEVPAEWTDPPMVELVAEKRRAVERAPRDGTAWGELGMAFDVHERNAEAVACYRAAAEFSPDDARWPFLLGGMYERRYPEKLDPAEAVRWYRLAVERRSPTPAHRVAAELTLADALAEQGKTAEAEVIYQRVYAADRTNPRAVYRLGMAAADRGDTAAAIGYLSTLARNPYVQKKAATALAALHRRAGRPKTAANFEYAASLFPQDLNWDNPFEQEMGGYMRGHQALFDAVTGAETRQDYRAAADAARHLVDLYPSPATQLVLGRALVHAKEYETAVPILEDAVAGDPNLVMAHAFLGIAQFHRAEAAYNAGRRPEATAHYLRSLAALGRAVELKPDYAPGHMYLAKALARLDRLPEAIRAARECVTLRPEEWEAHVTLGEVLAAAGQTTAAIDALEQAVKLANPNEPRPRQALERVKAGR